MLSKHTNTVDRITVENFLSFKEHLFCLDLFWNRISPCSTETGLASSSQAFVSWRLGWEVHAIAGISATSMSPYPAVSAFLQAVRDSPVLSQIYNLPFPSLLSGSLKIKTAKPWGVKSAHDTAKPKTELAINFIISTPSNLATRKKNLPASVSK